MSEIEKDLLAREQSLWRANREGDGRYYREVLTDDAVLVSRFGVADKEAVVSLITANRNPFIRDTLSRQSIRLITPDVATITYRADYDADVNGSVTTLSALATSVYVRDNGEWRLTLHQQTPLG